ncbi:PTS sugar transporter subunit IIC [Lacrimispora sp.]|jgi:PTS system cellobiose-specific IIC component|uniref:PTS sugar transporter subunit IIC n=1 Tax=Lacrimispora sp. TaxID=2719234 RepID=UPI00044C518A|nr:PTS sugar transporter subunit IIC [Lacrimispora sp.]EXG83459.1 PTS system protein, lactose/cellobiose family IIC component [Clostridium sp. ASBs410]MDR7813570.1 PTS sugar transporter subunit IIC [Lacrimispora sp.]
MKDFLNNKVIPKMMVFINTKAIRGLKDGLLYSMPMMIIGSIFLLLANFPYTPFANWLGSVGITPVLNQAYESTFNIMALIASIGIAYTYVKNEGYNGMPAGVISLCTYLLFQPSQVTNQEGANVGVIFKTWTGGQGMIGAIIIGLIVGWIYTVFLKKNITIKMPEGVPEGVAASFTALIPGAVVIIAASIIYAVVKNMFDTTPMEWIYKTIQIPLQGLTDSFGGVVAMGFLIPFFWFFGIHGSTLVGGIMGPLLTANSAANQAILDSGRELNLANGGHIVTQQFLDQFMTVTGAGITIGLVIYLTFFAKSNQCRQVGRLGIGPACFNINEPVLFGTPVVLNPIMAIPFMIMPVLSGTIQYLAIYTGLCPMYKGILVPWTCPPIISGFLIGGWRTALLQVGILALSFFVYLPFIRVIDKMYEKQENQTQG